METEVEVVEYTPKSALDRVLKKEKNKKSKNQEEKKEVVDSDQDQQTTLESEGQELLWVEDDNEEEEREPKSPTPRITPTKRKSFFKRLGNKKSGTPQKKNATVQKAPDGKVVLLPTAPRNVQKEAARKAHRARELLKEALLLDETSGDRNAKLKEAFAEAASARRLLDPNMEIGETSTGEKEALEASRILTGTGQEKMNARREEDTEKKKAVEPPAAAAAAVIDGKAATDRQTSEKTEPKASRTFTQFAADQSESARRFLESMLPEFLDEAVSDDEEDEAGKENNVNRANSKVEDAVPSVIEEDPEVLAIERKAAIAAKDAERRRRAEEKHAAITRVVQESNTMISNTMISTLGFDNTFLQDNDTLTIDSLNEFLDAPMSTEEKSPSATPQSATISKTERGVVETAGVVETPTGSAPTTKQRSFGFLSRVRSKRKKSDGTGAYALLTTPRQRSGKVDRCVATIVPPSDESEPNLTEEEQRKMVKIQDVDRVTTNRLKSAIHQGGGEGETVASWDGVPRHGTAPVVLQAKNKSMGVLPPKKAFEETSPRDPEDVQPTFVSAPKLDARSMTYKSYDQLADGEALEDVASQAGALTDKYETAEAISVDEANPAKPEPKRLLKRLFSRKTKKPTGEVPKELKEKELSTLEANRGVPIVSIEGGPTSTTESDDPAEHQLKNNLSAMTDDSYLMAAAEADKYTAVSDLEDDVHEEARKRLNHSKPIITDLDYMPEKPNLPSGIRQVFSWGGGKNGGDDNEEAAKPTYAEVDGEGVVLANEADIVSAIEAPTPRQAELQEQIDITRSVTNDCGVKRSDSFEKELEATAEKNAKQRELHVAAAASEQLSKPKKKLFGGLFKKKGSAAAQ